MRDLGDYLVGIIRIGSTITKIIIGSTTIILNLSLNEQNTLMIDLSFKTIQSLKIRIKNLQALT